MPMLYDRQIRNDPAGNANTVHAYAARVNSFLFNSSNFNIQIDRENIVRSFLFICKCIPFKLERKHSGDNIKKDVKKPTTHFQAQRKW